MTVGERIQAYRKGLGLSQEELGQKLLVSRQTISLWEKDQTSPTVDNLMRLSEVFGVSVDDILNSESNSPLCEDSPAEAYRFAFTKDEVEEIYRMQKRNFSKRYVILYLIGIFVIAIYIGSDDPKAVIGFFSGILFFSIVSHIKGLRAFSKACSRSLERICRSVYEYELFEDCIGIRIYRDNEKVSEARCRYTDIEKILPYDKLLIFQYGGQLYPARRSELKENSAFFSYMYKNPSAVAEKEVPNRWKSAANLLFAASLLSVLGALALMARVSNANGLFTENMWVFFLLTPIPIASVVVGFILKARGYRYKKNVIAGIIVTVILCLYGSFVFIF